MYAKFSNFSIFQKLCVHFVIKKHVVLSIKRMNYKFLFTSALFLSSELLSIIPGVKENSFIQLGASVLNKLHFLPDNQYSKIHVDEKEEDIIKPTKCCPCLEIVIKKAKASKVNICM
jgi:hypothetical protein